MSWNIVISGKHTASGKPLNVAGSQAGLTNAPGFFWAARVVNKELGMDLSGEFFVPIPLAVSGCFKNGKYIFTLGNQVGD